MGNENGVAACGTDAGIARYRTGMAMIVGCAMAASSGAHAMGVQQYHGEDQDTVAAQAGAADRPESPLEDRLRVLERRLDEQAARITELAQTVDRQENQIAVRDRQIQIDRVEKARLRTELAERQAHTQPAVVTQQSSQARTVQVAARQETAPQNQPPATAPAQQQADAPASGEQMAEAERPQSDRALDQLLVDQGGVLLPKGVLQIEPSIDYTSISSDRVNISGFSIFDAIVIGTIRVDDVNRDILTGAVTARYGTSSRSQVDLRVPYVYRNDTETTGVGTGDALERSTDGNGLGDISLTLSYQALTAKGGRPATIFRVQGEFPTGKSAFEIDRVAPSEDSPERILVEAPTGSGFYTISPGVTFVWPIDPVVLFAGGAFNYTFSREFDEFGLVEPGHGFEFFTGMNMSINERVSMNFSFLDKQRFATSSDGVKIPGSGTHDARLSLGASVGLSDRASLVVSSSAGLTDESPDFAFSVRLPIVF